MCQTEIDDAHKAIKEHGMNPDDFEISSSELDASGSGVRPVKYRVHVRRGHIQRDYVGGHSEAWVVEFEKDLSARLFSMR